MGEKNISSNLTNSGEPEQQGAACCLPLGAGAAWKTIVGAGAAWENNQEPHGKKCQEPEPLKKLACSSALVTCMHFFAFET